MDNITKNSRKLLSPEREQLIVQGLNSGVRTIGELAAKLGVSEATVRRDLLSLEESHLIKRVHGGAVPLPKGKTELRFHEKAEKFAQEKDDIAIAALDMISDGDSIFLDGGSTVLALAKKLDCKENLTIVTNSLMVAYELMNMESTHKLILLGGEFRAISRALVGSLTAPIADSIYVDKAFFGTIGVCEDGLFTTDTDEAFTKKNMIKRAEKAILLADSSKVGVKSLAKSGDIEEFYAIITDEDISLDFLNYISKFNCEVIKAKSNTRRKKWQLVT